MSLILAVCLSSISEILPCSGSPLSGTIKEEKWVEQNKTGTIVDIQTGLPVSNAIISVPSKGIFTRSDSYGRFNLDANLQGPDILSVKAEGYKPFSLTINSTNMNKSFTLAISRESGQEIIIDTSLRHLGDNNFSNASANARDFKQDSLGPHFSKEFYVDNLNRKQNLILKIGSIIGIDTEIARKLKQNKITTSSSSPTKIYINSQKVGEIRINGDNQEIFIPANLLIPNSYNQITVETGRNLQTTSYVDYDDIEFINLILELR